MEKGIALVKSEIIEDLADDILKKWGGKMKIEYFNCGHGIHSEKPKNL